MTALDILTALWALIVYNLAEVTNVAVATVVCIMLGCRVAKMKRGVTSLLVFLQHAVLALGMFGSILLSFAGHAEWAAVTANAGALLFLALSTRRWRHAAPAGTVRAQPVDTSLLRHVHGGTRSEP